MLEEKKIICTKVEFVKIADSRIVPDSGNLIVRKKARIETLKNAKILTNDVTKYYNIYDAKVDISTRYDYEASGTYDYVDENDVKQQIYFSSLKPDTTNQTIGTATIKEDKGFKISPNYDFYGDVNLASTNKNLEFSGQFKIAHTCDNIPQQWVEFTANIDPLDIYIPIAVDSTAKEDDPDKTYSGVIFNTTDSVSLYSSFLSSKSDASHFTLSDANGFLRYNSERKEYQISNKDKLTEYRLPGAYTSLNTKNCRLKYDGQFEMGIELGQLEIQPQGEIRFNPKKVVDRFKNFYYLQVPF